MDYIVTLLFASIVVFGGWYYGCDVRQWCGQKPEGVALTEVLAEAKNTPQQRQTDAKETNATQEKSAGTSKSSAQGNIAKDRAQERKDVQSAVAQKCNDYLTKDIRLGARNDKQEVIKLEKFLNTYEGEKLIAGGVYDGTDQAAVKRFQEKYRTAILDPAGVASPNGLVLKGTRKQINALYCKAQKNEKK